MPKKPSKTTSRSAAKTAAHTAGLGVGETGPRIARALEAIAAQLAARTPVMTAGPSFTDADAFVWHPDGRLSAVPRVSRVDLALLKGIDRMRDILIENTERFARGLPANNALLWGCLLYTSPSPRDMRRSRMPSSA